MLILTVAIIGAFFNAIRGGQFPSLTPFKKYDITNAVAFALTASLIHVNFWLFLPVGLSMIAGASSGWRDYIVKMWGMTFDKRRYHLKIEVDYTISFKWLPKWAQKRIKFTIDLEKPFERLYVPYPKTWGFCLLTLRGAMWGAFLGIPMLFVGGSFVTFVLLGASMGIIYFLMNKILPLFGINDRTRHWEYSEWVHGAILWAGIVA